MELYSGKINNSILKEESVRKFINNSFDKDLLTKEEANIFQNLSEKDEIYLKNKAFNFKEQNLFGLELSKKFKNRMNKLDDVELSHLISLYLKSKEREENANI